MKKPLRTGVTMSATVASLLGPLADAAPTAAQEQTRPTALRQQFGMLSLGLGQAARVNVVHINPSDPDIDPSDPDVDPTDPDRPPCQVRVDLINAAGEVVHSARAEVALGQASSFDFRVNPPEPDRRRRLRAEVLSINPSDPDTPSTPCEVISTFEIYNPATGRTTLFALPAAQIPPEPE